MRRLACVHAVVVTNARERWRGGAQLVCMRACMPCWSPADAMEMISKGENTTKPSTYLSNPRRRQACMMAAQVGVRAYIAAVVVNMRQVERWCTVWLSMRERWRGGRHQRERPRDGAQVTVRACVRTVVVVTCRRNGNDQ